MKYNELKSGTIITVEGRKDNVYGWWGARISALEHENYINGFKKTVALNPKVLEKIIKEGNYEIVGGTSCITKIKFC